MHKIIVKFEEYKKEFIESYKNFNYEKYQEACYKLYILYIENIIINSDVKIAEIDKLFNSLVLRFNEDSFISYLQFNKETKLDEYQWNWFILSEFTNYNILCADISKTVLNTITKEDQIINIILDNIKNLEGNYQNWWDSEFIPKEQSFYWNN